MWHTRALRQAVLRGVEQRSNRVSRGGLLGTCICMRLRAILNLQHVLLQCCACANVCWLVPLLHVAIHTHSLQRLWLSHCWRGILLLTTSLHDYLNRAYSFSLALFLYHPSSLYACAKVERSNFHFPNELLPCCYYTFMLSAALFGRFCSMQHCSLPQRTTLLAFEVNTRRPSTTTSPAQFALHATNAPRATLSIE